MEVTFRGFGNPEPEFGVEEEEGERRFKFKQKQIGANFNEELKDLNFKKRMD